MPHQTEIKHFLVIYDIAAGEAAVKRYLDYEEAMAAYAEAEQHHREDENLDIVLLSADSIETVERTHSSYFRTEETFERLLPPGILAA